MRPRSWRALHLVGIWYFWAAIGVSYTEGLLNGDTRIIAIFYVIAGLITLTFRLAAYLRDRSIPGVNSA